MDHNTSIDQSDKDMSCCSGGPSSSNSPDKTTTSDANQTSASISTDDDDAKKSTEASTLKKTDQTTHVDEKKDELKPKENEDTPDAALVLNPETIKLRRINEPEEESLCMNIVYSTVMCLDNCVIL